MPPLLRVLSNTSHRAEVVRAAGVAVGAVLGELGRGLEDSRGLASTIVTTLGQGLKYNYNRAWQTVLSVLAITVEVAIDPQVPAQLIAMKHFQVIHRAWPYQGEKKVWVNRALHHFSPIG